MKLHLITSRSVGADSSEFDFINQLLLEKGIDIVFCSPDYEAQYSVKSLYNVNHITILEFDSQKYSLDLEYAIVLIVKYMCDYYHNEVMIIASKSVIQKISEIFLDDKVIGNEIITIDIIFEKDNFSIQQELPSLEVIY